MKCDDLKPIKQGSVELGEYWVYDAEEVDAAIAELKTENERLKKCEIWMKRHFYCEEVIACDSAKIRRLKRALWLARAERYKMREFIAREEGNLCNQMSWSRFLRERTYEQWVDQLLRIANLANKLQKKCLAKAEEYK